MNREQWLTEAAEIMERDLFETPLPRVRVSCGWPSGGGKRKKGVVIGECWAPAASADTTTEVFISPVLDDPITVLATLAHELCHAYLPPEDGHKAPFARLAGHIGLMKPWTATTPGPDLTTFLETNLLRRLPKYPHAGMVTLAGGEPKQSTRMIKLECPRDGYVVRTTRKWLDTGLPSCPCGLAMVEAL